MPFIKEPRKRLSPEQRKYKAGDRFASVADFYAACVRGEWVCLWGGKPYHPAFAMSQQARTIYYLLLAGELRRAMRNTYAPYEYRAYFCEDTAKFFATCPEIYNGGVEARSIAALIRECRGKLPASARLRFIFTDSF